MALLDGVDLRHLAALRMVAAEQSFVRAAQRLGFTQSAVSQQIAVLERAVGAPVFDRPGGPRPVTLTPVGRALLTHAIAVLDRIEQADREVAELLAGHRDAIRVGTFQSVSVKVLPAIITRLREERPGVEITLFEDDDIRVLVDRLAADELDLAFVVGPYSDPRVDCEWLCRDRFVVLSPVGAPTDAVAPGALRGHALVGMPPTPCQALIDEGLRAHGVVASYVFRSSDSGAVQAMVRAGMGEAVMPFLAVDASDRSVVVRELEPPLPDRVIGLARRRGATMSPAADRFAQIARGVCDDVVGARGVAVADAAALAS